VALRVLFLTHRLPYAPNRGDRVRAFHLLKAMAPHAQVDLLSLVHDEEEASHAGDLRDIVATTTIARVPRLLNHLRGAALLATSRPLTHVLLDSPDVIPAIHTLMRQHPPDLVFAFCSGMMRFAMLPPLDKVPCILDMVDADSAKWDDLARIKSVPARWIYAREARCLGAFEASAMRHARATLVVNARERDILRRHSANARVDVLENGVALHAFSPTGPPSPNPVVVFCGVMNYAPNEQGAIYLAREVWPLVRKARPDARLMIVGALPTPSVIALGKDEGVTVTGAVDDVKPYLWDAAVAAAPLWTARGIQNKVLEAVAAGLPCVVVPPVAEGLPPEVTPACPVASDAASFARTLLELLSMTPAERRNRAGLAPLENLTWERRLQALPELLLAAARAPASVS
jgi:sugar transferase (PEP-CTERM/EpsH1 system associated)